MVRFTAEEVAAATGAAPPAVVSPSASFEGVLTDTRALTPGSLFVALVGERFDAHGFLGEAAARGAAGAVVQSGRARATVPAGFPLFEVPDTLHALGNLGRAHRRRFSIPMAAVTGSNGKTSTKEMIAAILATRGPALKTRGNLNNEVGVPLTLFGLEPGQVAAVVEMGMNHRGEIARMVRYAEPDVGIITSVGAAHLEFLGSVENIAEAKGELFAGLKPGARAVVNLDDPPVVEQARKSGVAQLTYGRAPGAAVRLEGARTVGSGGSALRVGYGGRTYEFQLPLLGAHNAQNACGAFAVGVAMGYGPDACAQGLSRVESHPGRLHALAGRGETLVIDDSYNANPASMAAALDTLESLAHGRRAVAVLGDMLELGPDEAREHAALGARAAAVAEKVAFFGPRSRSGFAEASKGRGGSAAHFEEISALLLWLEAEVRPGDVILVKASRGMRLERAVEALTGQAPQGAH